MLVLGRVSELETAILTVWPFHLSRWNSALPEVIVTAFPRTAENELARTRSKTIEVRRNFIREFRTSRLSPRRRGRHFRGPKSRRSARGPQGPTWSVRIGQRSAQDK